MKTRFSKDFQFVLVIALFIGLVGVATTLVVRQNSFSSDRSYIPEAVAITEEIRLLQRLVRAASPNPPGDVTKASAVVVEYLRGHGIEPERIEPAPGRVNLYARIKGKRAGEGLLLLQHLDVSPVQPAEWSKPPFEAQIEQHVLWGRGALDMKGIGVCHLAAFVAVAKSGRQPERDLVLLATADEETGGAFGTGWLIARRPDIFAGVKYAISEGGITEIIKDKLTRYSIEVGARQFVEMTATAPTRQQLQRFRISIEPLMTPAEPQRILPEVREYFRSVAPLRRSHSDLLADIDKTVRDGKFWLLEPAYKDLTYDGVVMMGVRAEGAAFASDVVLANLPDTDPDAAIERMRRRAEPFGVRLNVKLKMGPARIVSSSDPFFQHIARAAKKHFGEDIPVGPIILPYSVTDCRYLRTAGIACLGAPPFLSDYFQSEGIHGPNERVRLSWFSKGVKFTTQLVGSYVNGDN